MPATLDEMADKLVVQHGITKSAAIDLVASRPEGRRLLDAHNTTKGFTRAESSPPAA